MATEFHDPWRAGSRRRYPSWLDKIWLAPVAVAALVLSGIVRWTVGQRAGIEFTCRDLRTLGAVREIRQHLS